MRAVLTAVVAALLVALAAPAEAATLTARTKGYPASTNGASSMHLTWTDDPVPVRDVSVVLQVVDAPTVQQLYFWALQVEFVDIGGRTVVGESHLGLQWHPGHPGGTAVNFGGYSRDAKPSELGGDPSKLPSATGDPNTRDFAWKTGRAYRLRIYGAGDGWWTGEVTDLSTNTAVVVRRLYGGGTRLARPVVWSEVFAKCDDPTSAVRWSSFRPKPSSMQASYQSFSSGGCTNTTAQVNGGGIVQRTDTARTTRDFEDLRSGF